MLNPPIYIDGMLGMGDTIYQRAFVKKLPAGTFIKTAWPELYEDLPVKAVRSDTTLRTQRKNEFRSSTKFYPPPSPRQTKRIFYGPDDLRRGSIFDAMCRQFGVTPAALDLPSLARRSLRTKSRSPLSVRQRFVLNGEATPETLIPITSCAHRESCGKISA